MQLRRVFLSVGRGRVVLVLGFFEGWGVFDCWGFFVALFWFFLGCLVFF